MTTTDLMQLADTVEGLEQLSLFDYYSIFGKGYWQRERIAAWLAVGFDVWAMTAWSDRGFTLYEACKWRQAGFTNSLNARAWYDKGYNPKQARKHEVRYKVDGLGRTIKKGKG